MNGPCEDNKKPVPHCSAAASQLQLRTLTCAAHTAHRLGLFIPSTAKLTMRLLLDQEREDAVEKERVTSHNRLLQEAERHKCELASERTKLLAEAERERKLLVAQHTTETDRQTAEMKAIKKSHEEDIRHLQEEFNRWLECCELRSLPRSL